MLLGEKHCRERQQQQTAAAACCFHSGTGGIQESCTSGALLRTYVASRVAGKEIKLGTFEKIQKEVCLKDLPLLLLLLQHEIVLDRAQYRRKSCFVASDSTSSFKNDPPARVSSFFIFSF